MPTRRAVVASAPRLPVAAPVGGGQQAITIEVPLPPEELHPNARAGWRQHMHAKRQAREDAMYATLAVVGHAHSRWERVRATAVYTFPVNRKRDGDSLQSWLKYYRDGIAAVVMRDGDDHGWTWEGVEAVVDKRVLSGVVITVWPVDEKGDA